MVDYWDPTLNIFNASTSIFLQCALSLDDIITSTLYAWLLQLDCDWNILCTHRKSTGFSIEFQAIARIIILGLFSSLAMGGYMSTGFFFIIIIICVLNEHITCVHAGFILCDRGFFLLRFVLIIFHRSFPLTLYFSFISLFICCSWFLFELLLMTTVTANIAISFGLILLSLA